VLRVLIAVFAMAALAPPARAEERLELWTMGPSDVVFERFGHAALCLGGGGGDDLVGTCWNYGTADFSDPPRLVWEFLRHRAKFWASLTSMRATYAAYVQHDRSVFRQVIPLSPEKLALAKARLAHDQEPANRYYVYHHFDDNCTTRLRDIIDDAVDGRLAGAKAARYPTTLRAMVRYGFSSSRLLLAGAEILIGRTADRQPTAWDAMYHPDVLREEVQRRLGIAPETLYARRGPLPSGDPRGGQLSLALLGLALAAIVLGTRWSRVRALGRGGRVLAGLVLGTLGLLLWGLALIAPQRELRQNELLLVLQPLDLALGLLPARWLMRYARARLLVLGVVAVLAVAGVLIQPLVGPLLLVALPIAAAWPRRDTRAQVATAAANPTPVASAAQY
jgi:hypothetical protein